LELRQNEFGLQTLYGRILATRVHKLSVQYKVI